MGYVTIVIPLTYGQPRALDAYTFALVLMLACSTATFLWSVAWAVLLAATVRLEFRCRAALTTVSFAGLSLMRRTHALHECSLLIARVAESGGSPDPQTVDALLLVTPSHVAVVEARSDADEDVTLNDFPSEAARALVERSPIETRDTYPLVFGTREPWPLPWHARRWIS